MADAPARPQPATPDAPRPVLVATDFSAHARHAADRAARIAREKATSLALLHVMPGEPLLQLRQWLGAASAPEADMRAEATRRLARVAGDLQATRQVETRSRVAAGEPIDEILREADVLDARLIVLGARGTGFLRRLVLGTTAERLLRRTTRPLLVVRQLPQRGYRRLLVAVDFSPWSAHALGLARRTAPHAHLMLFTACQVPFEDQLVYAGVDRATIESYREKARAEATRKLHALAWAAGLKPGQWEPCVVDGDASLRIVEKEQELDCDLVVLGKHGVAASVDLLLGSVTQHVLAEGSSDVLVSTARDA